MTTVPLILFSTNTYIAWYINENFYKGNHFVWCAPFLSTEDAPALLKSTLPPSSTPSNIYRGFKESIRNTDHHSSFIEKNCIGLKNGAQKMFDLNVISNGQLLELGVIINEAQKNLTLYFKPLIYIIPYNNEIKKKVVSVSPLSRANPISPEFQIHSLKSKEFYPLTEL